MYIYVLLIYIHLSLFSYFSYISYCRILSSLVRTRGEFTALSYDEPCPRRRVENSHRRFFSPQSPLYALPHIILQRSIVSDFYSQLATLHLTPTSLIQPLGLHRTSHLAPSKGKKRKRKTPFNTDEDIDIKDAPPPPPPSREYLLIGLNAVTRHLEALAATNAPSTLPTFTSQAPDPSTAAKEEAPTPSNSKAATKPSSKTQDASTKPTPPGASTPVSAQTGSDPATSTTTLPKVTVLILPTPNPSASLAHSHLPTLLYLSSPPWTNSPKSNTPTSTTTASSNPSTSPSKSTPSTAPRLILLPPLSETRLAAALGIPRVGALAVLENAPGAETMVSYCRDKVGTVECAWISESLDPQWSGIKGGY
jgi:ribonuclease P/MRP protein subunit POP3